MKTASVVAFRAETDEGAGGATVRVGVEVTAAAAAVSVLFPDYRVPPGSEPPDLVLASLGERGYSVRSKREHLGAPTLSEAVGLLEQVLTRELAASLPGFGVLHGAAVGATGGAVLIPGPGGAGKSTLAAGLAARGCPLLGDDVVLLDLERGVLYPFKRLVKLDDRATGILRVPPRSGPLRSLWPERSLFHPRDLGSSWAPPSSLSAVILPRRDDAHSGDPVLRPVSGGEAVKEILEQVLLVERVGSEEFLATADAVASARLAELRFRRSDRAVELLASELLRQHP